MFPGFFLSGQWSVIIRLLHMFRQTLRLDEAVRNVLHNKHMPSLRRSERKQISVYWGMRSRPTSLEMSHKKDAALKMSGH